MMRMGSKNLWVVASVLTFALAGCCDSSNPLGVRQSGGAGPGPVPLATASGFAILAGSTVTNTGATAVTGDLGVSPGAAVTGFPPGTVTGTIHAGDAAAATAQADLTTAYNDAAGRTTGAIAVSGDL